MKPGDVGRGFAKQLAVFIFFLLIQNKPKENCRHSERRIKKIKERYRRFELEIEQVQVVSHCCPSNQGVK